MQNKYFSRFFAAQELEKLFDLTTYTGTATQQREEVIKSLRMKREIEVEQYELKEMIRKYSMHH